VIKLTGLFVVLSTLCIFTAVAQQNLSSVIYLANADIVAFKNAVFMIKSTEGIDQVTHRQSKDANSPALIYFTFQNENARVSAMQQIYNSGYQPFLAGTNVPADFPQLMNDSSKTDRISFAEAKALWIDNNPERYAEMNESSTVTIISQQEFDELPENKQEHILEHPELYTIE